MQFMSTTKHFVSKCPKNERQISSTSSSSSEEIRNTSKLDITLTNRGFQLYGTLSKRELLKLLEHKLEQCIHVQLISPGKISYETTHTDRSWITISSGLYSTNVLKILQKNGMSVYSIMKAMKLGLINLNCCELCCFKDFNVDPYILEFKEMWSNKLNDELILNLKPIGLTELECWNIIVYGVAVQKSHILCRLMLSGIDIPGILIWQSPIKVATPEIIQFLIYIGIEKNIIQLVEKYGIDEETEQMLIDIGLNEMKEQFSNMEEIVCENKLTIMNSDTSSSKETQDICKTNTLDTISSSTDTSSYFQPNSCQCHLLDENKTAAELTAQRNDYLRQNIMVPLTWAMARTLNYKPTDPTYYTAYQLLRWTDNVSETEKDTLGELIALYTIKMDNKLIVSAIYNTSRYLKNNILFLKKIIQFLIRHIDIKYYYIQIGKKRLEELIRSLNEKDMRNTVCKNLQQLQCIKQRHCKCIRKSVKNMKFVNSLKYIVLVKSTYQITVGFSHLQHE